MDHFILHNDQIIPLAEARLSPGQMGLFMGWGVFTTLRIYRGYPFAFERHWARMGRDAERLGMTLGREPEVVREAMVKLAEANHRSEGMARLLFVKNHGGVWAEAEDRSATDLLGFTRELVAWPTAHRLKILPNAIFSLHRLAGAKMLSWVQNAAALEQARQEGFDDALLLNEKGQLVECTSANFFLVRAGRVLTPPLSSGCLPGVTRDVLREIAPRIGIVIEEQDLFAEDLDSADEVFISSTTREVASVGTISPDWNFKAPGRIARALEEAFQQYVQSHRKRTPTPPH
jgi:branched-chain amino acid aminotransferase